MSEEIKKLTEDIFNEVLKDCERVMWNIAHSYHIRGYDADDLMQEMRLKIWETIKNNQYDPERTKPTTFYHRVCFNCVYSINAKKFINYQKRKGKELPLVPKDALDASVPYYERDLAWRCNTYRGDDNDDE